MRKLLFAILVCTTPLFGSSSEESEPRYLPAGQSSEETKTDDQEQDNDEENQIQGSISLFPKMPVQATFSAQQQQIFQTEHNGVFIPVNLFGPWAEAIQLKDGSVWIVSPEDSFRLANWVTDHVVVVTPNGDNPFYKFRLNNQNTSSAVNVYLHQYLNPVYHNIYNHRIVNIDSFSQKVWLEDGSVWDLAWADFSRKWLPGDTIIIGINNGARSATMPNVLINCRLSHAARAHRLN